MEKVTIKAQVAEIANKFNGGVALTEDEVKFLIERAEKSIRKASTKKGETKAHKENVALAEKVVDFIAERGVVTTKDVENFLGVSNQKATAVLKVAVANGEVAKTEAKGKVKASFAIAE